MKNYQVIFTPHPPIIIKEIGNGREEEANITISGMELAAKRIEDYKPKTIIFVTPHGNSFSNGTCILSELRLSGSFEGFGHKDISYQKKVDIDLSNRIFDKIEEQGYISVLMDNKTAKSYRVKTELDHGIMVPMYFIDKYFKDYNIVHITPGLTSLEENYHIGKLIGEAIKEVGYKVILLCSGDLSHALSNDGPYTYNEKGEYFDNLIKKSIEEKNVMGLLSLDNKTIEDAAQCGLRSFLMGFGLMDGYEYGSQVFSYEGPFGVGYLTGVLNRSTSPKESILKKLQEKKHEEYNLRISKEDEFILLARKNIENYIYTGKRLSLESIKDNFPQDFINRCQNQKSGVFVSIHKDNMLRGCIGTISSTCDNLLDEILYNSISAATKDPRFEPVRPEELLELDIKVDILYESEEIKTKDKLDVKKYGVIVEKGSKRGLLLPNLEGVDSVNQQVSIAMEKAGIRDGQGMKLFRFEVERHEYPSI